MKVNFDKRVLAASVAAACSWMGMDANAAGSHTVSIAAAVTSKCTFNSGASTVSLAIDPSLTTNVTGPAAVLYKCTKGVLPTMVPASTSTNSATAGNLINGTENFAYSYSTATGGAGGGFGAGTDKTYGVTVTVNQAAAANVSAATFTDTIVITLTP
jgi:hypothetical protein